MRLAATALFLLAAAFTCVKTGRDALFLQDRGWQQLPWAYIGTALLAIPQALVIVRMLERFSLRLVRMGVLATYSVVVAAYWYFAEPGGSIAMTLFFLAVPLGFSVIFSTHWLMAVALLPSDGRGDGFRWLGAAAITGTIAGATWAQLLGERLGPRGLLLTGMVIMLVVLAMEFAVRTGATIKKAPVTNATPDAPIWRQPLVVLLSCLAVISAFAAIFIDFNMYVVASRMVEDPRGGTRFFSLVYLLLGGVSLFLQVLVTPRMHASVGLVKTLVLMPVTLVLGAAVQLLAGAQVAQLLRVTEGGLKAGMQRTSWEKTFFPVEPKRRPTAKVWVDGLWARIGEGAAAGLILVVLAVFATDTLLVIIPGAVVVFGALWLFALWRLRRQLKVQCIVIPPGEPNFGAPLPDF